MENPRQLSIEEIKGLLEGTPRAPAVTIYLPTHRRSSPPNISEDQIRLKNLKNRAAEIIRTREDGKEYLDEFLARLNELLEDTLLWENQTEGLLICARPGLFRLFKLPLDTSEYLAVSEQFHLGPVFGLLGDMREFYVLSVAQHQPALFKGDFYRLSLMEVKLPPTIEKGLMIDEMRQKGEQQRSSYGDQGGVNGRGGSKNPKEEERQRFWRLIDKTIQRKMDKQLPLILAGTESEVTEFKNISGYKHILSGHIEGSFTPADINKLFKPALELLKKEVVWPEHQQATERFAQLAGQNPDLTGVDFAAITKSADDGRVGTLLLSAIRFTADTVRDNSEPVEVISLPLEDSAQAVNATAREVWSSGGRIVNVRNERMPVKDSLMLAVMRY